MLEFSSTSYETLSSELKTPTDFYLPQPWTSSFGISESSGLWYMAHVQRVTLVRCKRVTRFLRAFYRLVVKKRLLTTCFLPSFHECCMREPEVCHQLSGMPDSSLRIVFQPLNTRQRQSWNKFEIPSAKVMGKVSFRQTQSHYRRILPIEEGIICIRTKRVIDARNIYTRWRFQRARHKGRKGERGW